MPLWECLYLVAIDSCIVRGSLWEIAAYAMVIFRYIYLVNQSIFCHTIFPSPPILGSWLGGLSLSPVMSQMWVSSGNEKHLHQILLFVMLLF